ncbi:MAG: SusD/RagB family nutrient-binding outer membrane lipoprotein [Mucilaginibacter sp.]
MKRDHNSTKYITRNRLSFVLGSVMALALTSCTKNFDKYNTDPNKLNGGQSLVSTPTAFGPMEQAIFADYQRAQNLSADGYCGYLQPGIAFGGDQNNLTYVMNDGWNSTGFNDQYNQVMSPVYAMSTTTPIKSVHPEAWAVALIIEVEAMDRVTDRFGPIPYTKVGTSLTTAPYDDQQTVYNTFFKQLDTAVTNLKAYIAAPATVNYLGSNDYIYGGDYSKWLKLANSLRLRLAMRIVKVDAATAQAQAQKALTDSGGLLSAPSDDAAVAQTGGRENDLYQLSHDWNNTNLDGAIESYMTGYNDPRFAVYFQPAQAGAGSAYAGKWLGIRTGSVIGSNQGTYSNFANLNTSATFQFTTPQLIMTAAEVWFLKAEAALRGWSTDNVQTDYETGVATSMTQWGASIGNYLSDATSTEANFTDPLNSSNNINALSNITIKWDNSATQEQKLERIITQKWLAIFPDGQEAWADYRRTGYPKLFPVANNFSGGLINTQTQIRRLPYPASEYTSNNAAVTHAVTLLGGADNGNTRLWWDVNKANF